MSEPLFIRPDPHGPAYIRQDVADAMYEALDGCLHFDDAFIRDGALGVALKQWRNAARSALAKARGEA